MRRAQLPLFVFALTGFLLHLPVLTHAGTQAGIQAPVQILFTGVYHGDEVEARDGEQWWAMDLDGRELTSLHVGLRTVWDPIVDNDDEATGKEVTLPDEREALFLVRGVPGLRPVSPAQGQPKVYHAYFGKYIEMNRVQTRHTPVL